MTKGYVYCMSSPCHYDVELQRRLYKIGRTSNDPRRRLKEMNAKTTNVPCPFVYHFVKKVKHAEQMEKKLHVYFAKDRYNPNREYFAVKLEDIQRMFEFIDGMWWDTSDQDESDQDSDEESDEESSVWGSDTEVSVQGSDEEEEEEEEDEEEEEEDDVSVQTTRYPLRKRRCVIED